MEKYIYFAYRLSKLSCEGGSIYQGKYTVHTTSKTENQARLKKERHISAVNARFTHKTTSKLSYNTTSACRYSQRAVINKQHIDK